MGLSNRTRMPPPALGETDRQPVDDARIVGAIWALVPGDHRTRAQRLDGVKGGDRVAAATCPRSRRWSSATATSTMPAAWPVSPGRRGLGRCRWWCTRDLDPPAPGNARPQARPATDTEQACPGRRWLRGHQAPRALTARRRLRGHGSSILSIRTLRNGCSASARSHLLAGSCNALFGDLISYQNDGKCSAAIVGKVGRA